MTRLTIIVAATKNNGIGKNNDLPWRISKELKYFTSVTSSAPEGRRNVVVMGRNSWEALPPKHRPLTKRLNVVVSKNKDYNLGVSNDSSLLKNDLESAVAVLDEEAEPYEIGLHRGFIIGGASIYAESLNLPFSTTQPFVDRFLLTRILSPEFDCDVFMPDFLKPNSTVDEYMEWKRASHDALREWVGFEVPEGEQLENGVAYEFQMWVRGGAV